MCKLTHNSKEDKEEGYKVVIKKEDGRYYSAAMGFKYRTDRKIPIVKRQRRLSDWFNKMILDEFREDGFSSDMVGRTAIFLGLQEARNKAQLLTRGEKGETLDATVVKATVSREVMLGTYGIAKIAAGRRIKFGEEVEKDGQSQSPTSG